MKATRIFFTSMIVLMAIIISSCENTPAPTAEIFATIDGYKVTFEPTVTDTQTYLWDFGDGKGTSTEAKPVYTYESFGDYTVKLTVTGEGGTSSTTKVVTILATSVKDLLTGGIKATNGKTWVLSKTPTTGFDGAGTISSAPYLLEVAPVVPADALNTIGLGDEYDEFTFSFDGKYKMNLRNGKALTGYLFALANGLTISVANSDMGLCAAGYSAPSSATWTLNTNDLVMSDVIKSATDYSDNPVHGPVTIKCPKGWISLTQGAFFGVYDFPATAKFVIDEITSTKMKASLFLCGYATNFPNSPNVQLPNTMLHLTFESKAK